MAKRGRPPHPDILTPREWEVLDLLREGHSNDDIAQRLGISLAGAKYHVSEILGKLGVSSREEAARWERPERPWWMAAFAPFSFFWRRIHVAWLSPAVAAGLAVLVAVGIGLLVWGLLRTNGGGEDAWLGEGWTTEGAPERLTYEPGEEIDVPGIFYLDPDSGEVEGWTIPPFLHWDPYSRKAVSWPSTTTADEEAWPIFEVNGISPDGRLMVFEGREDRTPGASSRVAVSTLFDTRRDKVCDLEDPVSWGVSFTPDGRRIVSLENPFVLSSACGTSLHVLEDLDRFYYHGEFLSLCCRFPNVFQADRSRLAPDGSKLLLAGTFLTATHHPPAAYLVDLERGAVDLLSSGEGSWQDQFKFEWAPDGSRFALTSVADGTVRAFDPEGNELWSTELPMEYAFVYRWSPDGSLLAAVGSGGPDHESFALYILDGKTGEIQLTLPDAGGCAEQFESGFLDSLPEYPGRCSSQAWSADGERLLVLKYEDGYTHHLVDLSGTELLALPASVLAAAASPTEPHLIALLEGGTRNEGAPAVAVMRTDTRQRVMTVDLTDDVSARAVGWLDGGRVWFFTARVPKNTDIAPQ